MPVILDPADYRTWLEADDPHHLLKPPPVEMLQCYSFEIAISGLAENK